MKRLLFTVLLAFLVAAPAFAAQIVTTLPPTTTNTTGIGGTNDYAAGFVWNSAGIFASADLYLGVEGDPTEPLKISLYDDLLGVPGSELLVLSGPNDIFFDGLYTYTGSYALTQGATYWIVATTGIYSDVDNEYIWWDGTLGDPNYVDTVWRRLPDAPSWSSSGIVVPAAFRVNDANVPVPDPGSTLFLLGMSLMGLKAWKKLRR